MCLSNARLTLRYRNYAMVAINHVQLLGNVGQDPIKIGDKLVKFSVATNSSWLVKEEDSGISVVVDYERVNTVEVTQSKKDFR